VGPLGPAGVGRGPAAARRGAQPGAAELALEGALRRELLAGGLPVQQHADQPGPPGGVLAAQAHGLVQGLLGGRAAPRAAARVRRRDGAGPVQAQAPQQVPHGPRGQAEGPGDGGGVLAALGPSPDGLTQRQGDGLWHVPSS
jgi:hypothetical protein